MKSQLISERKIKIPDAIIWATAKYKDSLLITRNTKDFFVSTRTTKIKTVTKVIHLYYFSNANVLSR